MTKQISADTRLLLSDNVMAVVITTKGRWVKIQRADKEQGVESNISFNDAFAASDRYVAWAEKQGISTDRVGDTAISPERRAGGDRRHSETSEPKKEAKMEAQKQTPPVRPAAPAHFVGDVAPGKRAKIKDTNFDLSRYFVSDTKTPTGRRTIDCADEVAARLRGMHIEDVYLEAAEATGMDVDVLKSTYSHLNLGMQRMSLGNRIRGAAKAREEAAAKEARKAEREAARQAKEAEREAARQAREAAKAEREAEREAARQAKEAEREAARQAKEAAKAE